jgi:hypothetical protein
VALSLLRQHGQTKPCFLEFCTFFLDFARNCMNDTA